MAELVAKYTKGAVRIAVVCYLLWDTYLDMVREHLVELILRIFLLIYADVFMMILRTTEYNLID
jgi:hypothetical protein